MAICDCGFLPAAVSLLLLAVLFMQISGVSLTFTWPRRLCLPRVLLGLMPLLQAFPFPNTLGEVTLHLFSQAGVFIYSSCGKWVFPPLLWSFPPPTTFTSFPTPGCWACAAAPTFSSQLVVRDFPSLPFGAKGAPPSLLHVFLVIAYYSVLFSFFPGWGSVCPGGYADLAQGCLWKYHMPLSSPGGLCLPKPSGHRRLVAAWEPSWFLHLT
jgi:hypothetical protein